MNQLKNRDSNPFLLGLKVCGVGGVAALGVAVVALDVVVVLGLLNHHNLERINELISQLLIKSLDRGAITYT